MLLLDSSVWIDIQRGQITPATQFALEQESRQQLALTECIYLEVMQGAKNEQSAKNLHRDLAGQIVLAPHGLETYALAAELYRKARSIGLTIRSTIDCLVAAQALENHCILLHSDRDFFALQKVAPDLVIYPAVLH